MTRLEYLLESMHPLFQAACSPVGAVRFVLTEYAPCAERDMVVATAQQFAAAQRELCRLYNNIRSQVSRLETVCGNVSPAFYEGTIRETGELPAAHCTCA